MRRRIRAEEGSATIIFTAFVSSLLLIAIVALVVDSGVVYLERRSVVNAAQSAALALGKECAERPTNCASFTLPDFFANANSPDGLTKVTEICLNGKTPLGVGCQPLSQSRLDCAPLAPESGNFVRIRTQSQEPNGNAGISTFFSRSASQTLNACAQVRWGNALSASVYTPFAVSICEWSRQRALPRILLEFKSSDGVADCTYTFSDLSGVTYTRSGINGWAALDLLSASLPVEARSDSYCPDPATEKAAFLKIGYQLSQITRDQSSPNYCGNGSLLSKMGNWLNQTLYIPLVSTKKLSGNSTVHTIEAFAAFKLLGFSLLKGNGASSDVGGTYPTGSWCSKNTNCIYGEFISTISSNSEISNTPGTPNVGLQAIELI